MMAAARVHPLSVEVLSTARWILMDFADVVVHVFRADIREHYGLEKLWNDAKRVRLPSERGADQTPLVPVQPAKRPARARR